MSKMGVLTSLIVGPFQAVDGAFLPARGTRYGGQVVQQASGKYREAVLRGSVYHASAATNLATPQTNIGTTAPFTLFNPVNSGVTYLLLRASLAYTGGTYARGVATVCVDATANQAPPTSGTALSVQNALVGLASRSTANCRVTATVANTPTPIFDLCWFDVVGTATAIGPTLCYVDIDGAIALLPGTRADIQTQYTAAPTTPTASLSMMWEEIPLGRE